MMTKMTLGGIISLTAKNYNNNPSQYFIKSKQNQYLIITEKGMKVIQDLEFGGCLVQFLPAPPEHHGDSEKECLIEFG